MAYTECTSCFARSSADYFTMSASFGYIRALGPFHELTVGLGPARREDVLMVEVGALAQPLGDSGILLAVATSFPISLTDDLIKLGVSTGDSIECLNDSDGIVEHPGEHYFAAICERIWRPAERVANSR